MMSILRAIDVSLQPVVGLVHMIGCARKLRQLMPKGDAIRLARYLTKEDPASLPVAGESFSLRQNTTDLYTFKDVFLHDSAQPPLSYTETPCFIVDCGAHIGCASRFFALRYPSATIVSIEPDPENFQLLNSNLAACENVEVINAAIWDQPGTVMVANPGTNPTGRFVVEANGENGAGIQAFSIEEIMAEYNAPRINILKVDIEGAEKRLFQARNSSNWLSKVDVLMVELHDRIVPGCAQAMFAALADFEYELIGNRNVIAVQFQKPTSGGHKILR